MLHALGQFELDRDLETGSCATNLHRFPLQAWTRMLARRARRGGHALLVPSDPLGLPELRHEIASYASLTRGLRCTADHVLVLGSTQEALDLVARVIADPGESVVMENPGYRGARAAFLGAGLRLLPVPVDRHGLVTRALPSRGRTPVAYLTPSHQFPLGVTMSLQRRLELLRWAERRDAWLIEDDYDSEFRHDGRPIAALQSLAPGARVLYVGTYNKVLFPGLRLAYVILPDEWLGAFAAARRVASGGWAPLLQAVLAEFIASGRFAGYLRAARQFYTRSRDRLVESIAAHWGDAVTLGPSSTGLHVVAHLGKRRDDVALARAVRRHALPAAPLSGYYAGAPARPGLVIGYGSSNPDALAVAVKAAARHVVRP
jgi:GntR family transcriptional regulator/MocR family aminotransferase